MDNIIGANKCPKCGAPSLASLVCEECKNTHKTPHTLWSDRPDSAVEDIKERLNGIVWEYAPGGITLQEAEEISCDLLTTFLHHRNISTSEKEN